ncbi:MAG: choice-of-anchor D domain-containing protein [Candidatus Acidiferrales bacterium]
MSRRLVSVCILALAGITSFSAGRFRGNERLSFPPVPPESQSRNIALSRGSHVAGVNANRARMRAATSRRSAPISIAMTFEPNVGQFDARVRYLGRGTGMTLLLTRKGMDVEVADLSRAVTQRIDVVRVRLSWVGRSDRRLKDATKFSWRGAQRLKTMSNYFIGRNAREWQTNVPHFARAIGETDSDGRVGMAVYGTSKGVEYDLRLAPGADATKLRLRFSGAKRMELSGGGVILHAGGRELRMAKPRIFAELAGGARTIVSGEYVMEADGSVGFRIGPHDPRATLVIDPSLTVTYATFLGGAGSETTGNVAIDANGKIYVSGATTSTSSFPEASAATVGPVVGASAFYVAKIDPTVTGANSLVYLTFLGGSGTQTGGLIALDGAGDVAVTGTTTSTDFPVTGSSQPTQGLTSGDGNDAVVSEINAEGNQLNFSAYFGGSGELSENGTGGIAVDQLGNVYIASDAQPSAADPGSPDLPVTNGAFQTTWDGEESDGYLAVFAPPAQTGGAPSLTYCTYLGTYSAGPAAVGGVAVDSNGNAYVAGTTSNPSYGFLALNAIQSEYGGGASDGFVMKIAPTAQGPTDLVYATFLGGSGMDEILGIALDPPSTLPVGIPPKAYVTGATQSTNFPVNGLNAAYQSTLCASLCGPSSQNAFIAVIAQDAVSGQTSLAYSSYLGGSATDDGLSIAVAAASSVYVAGQTNSPDFPWRDNLQPFNGSADAFLAKFDPTSSGASSFIYSTPLAGTSTPGGTVSAAASGVAASGTGQVYVTGQTTAADFPTAITTSGAANGFQQTCTSCQKALPSNDAFVLALTEISTAEPSVYFNLGSENFGSFDLGTNASGQPLAVLNGGEGLLTISDIEIVGPNASDFATVGQAACIGTSIAPGTTPHCSMDVRFTPSVGGPEEAFLAVTDNAPGSPQLLEMEGVGAAPHAQVLPAILNFENQPSGSASAGQTITITNTGNQTLSFTQGPFLLPPFNVQENHCAYPNDGILAPGANCTLQVVFAPTTTGPAQEQLDLVDNSDYQSSALQMVSLNGNGTTPAPLAQVSPATLTFGNTLLGSTSTPQSVTLQNQGSAALEVNLISLGGTNAADFEISITGTTCPTAGGTLASGGTCTVEVQLAPQSAGSTKTATLSFTDNATGSPQTVALSGIASSPATLTVSPASLNFGSQGEGTSSAAQILTITNSGSGTASLSGIATAGSTDFAQQNACPPVLSAGTQCQVSVTFAPAESAGAGTRSGTLKIPGGTPATVVLSGTATQPTISFTTSVNFAPQLVGTAGAPQPITITNSSSGTLAGALAFTGISIGGANKSNFAITTNQCEAGANASIAPGSSCTIQIAFQPQSAATCGDDPSRSASLQLQDNAPGSPQTITLAGPAADFCMASSNGQPVTAPIQPGQTASYALEIASTGGFTGTVTLSCASPSGDEIGPCSIATTPASNPFSVQVTPTAPGQFTVNVPTVAPSAVFPRGLPPTAGTSTRFAPMICAGIVCLLLLACAIWGQRGGFAYPSSRLVRFLQIAGIVVGLALGMAACGSGGGSDPASDLSDPGTPPGTYTITVTATTMSGGTSSSKTASLTLTVE